MAFSLALTAGTLFFVFRGIDYQVLQGLLAQQHRLLLLAAAFFLLLQIGFGALRWRTALSGLVRGRLPSIGDVVALFYASIFFNCLPVGTIGGDVARVLLARKHSLPVKQLVLSVLIDRILAVAAVTLLAVVTLPSIAHPLARPAWLGGMAILLAGMAGILLLGPLERMLGRWRHWSLFYLAVRAVEELRYLSRSGGTLGLIYGVVSAVFAALAGYSIARSLDIGVGLLTLTAIISMMTLIVALPISAAGWGVREVSLVTLLGFVGVDRAAALLLSVEFGVLTTLVSLPGGVIWLTLRERDATAELATSQLSGMPLLSPRRQDPSGSNAESC